MLCSSLLSSPLPSLSFRLPSSRLPLPRTPFLQSHPPIRRVRPAGAAGATVLASLIENPVLWAARLCVYYVLLNAGAAGSDANPFASCSLDSPPSLDAGDAGDLGFSQWIQRFTGDSDVEREAQERRKHVSKWHPTTKGTLKRSYRVPSAAQGRRLLKAIANLLSDDDNFVDAACHKGCQIRRETAHGESVCCNNVRALFDELPTPHLVVEITPFPAGSLTDKDYVKAENLERVLRSGSSSI